VLFLAPFIVICHMYPFYCVLSSWLSCMSLGLFGRGADGRDSISVTRNALRNVTVTLA